MLGSCVAVCLWDPIVKLGGINHYMLPTWNGNGLATPRYGNIAIVKLIEKLECYQCSRSRMEAKVFGGAEVLANPNGSPAMKVGERNIAIADFTLKEFNIPLVARCVGGKNGFKLIYKTHTGEVLLRRLSNVSRSVVGNP